MAPSTAEHTHHGSPLRLSLTDGGNCNRRRQGGLQLRQTLESVNVSGFDAVAVSLTLAHVATMARHGRKRGRSGIGVLANNVSPLNVAFHITPLPRQLSEPFDALALCSRQETIQLGMPLLVNAIELFAAERESARRYVGGE
jgi:hypothetical protein